MTAAVPGGGRRRVWLRREHVVTAAGVVAERQGITNVTMAAVAAELEVTSMALYTHVRDKQHLMTLLLDSLLATIDVAPPSAGRWDVRLRRLHQEVTAAMSRYAGLVSEANEPEEVPRLLDGYLQILLDAGFGERATALAYTGFYYLAMGAQQPFRGEVGTPAARAPSDVAAYPATARVAPAIAGAAPAELQHFVLDVYLDGLRHLHRSIGK